MSEYTALTCGVRKYIIEEYELLIIEILLESSDHDMPCLMQRIREREIDRTQEVEK